MNLGERIRELRKEKDLSQQELADQIGIHVTNLNRLENGHSHPSYEVIIKLMELFEVTANFLLMDSSDALEVQIQNKPLAERIRLIDALDEKDQTALLQVIDSMLTKQRMKDVLEKAELAS